MESFVLLQFRVSNLLIWRIATIRVIDGYKFIVLLRVTSLKPVILLNLVSLVLSSVEA